MTYPVTVYAIHEKENILSILKHVSEYGVAIAWISENEKFNKVEVGLVDDFKDVKEFRQFMQHMSLISEHRIHPKLNVPSFIPPISPLCPSKADPIALEDCLFVPENFK